MNKNSMDALFAGLTGPVEGKEGKEPIKGNDKKGGNVTTTPRSRGRKKVSEEERTDTRFCSVVNKELLQKIRIIAERESLPIKDVVNAAFSKAVKSYEAKHGEIISKRGDASRLF